MRSLLHTPTRLAAALALSGLLVTGCADDEDADVSSESPSPTAVAPEPTATGPTSSPSDTRSWATCVATRADLQVSYPTGWTVKDHPNGGCAYFDPQPFDVERGTEAPSVAIRLDVEAVAYERVKQSYLESDVISQRDAEIAGNEAIRIEDRDTEGPLAPKGHRVTYLADLGTEQTLVLTTNETDAEDFAAAQQLLDEMAQRLQRAG
jgi:hypothetical protein